MSAQAPQPAIASVTVFFPCSACGKELKTRASLAGKKVACPSCGAVMAVPRIGSTAPAPPPQWKQFVPPLVLAVVLLATFLLKLHNLDHTGLTRWDEVFHAVVAQNVLKHPLKPTLFDTPYLPYNAKTWGENHVWLHKPILPFWQVALSFAVLGVNTFALRLPAAILSTASAWLTYLIGTELLDRRAALIAAALQAVNPFVMALVHGYQFADNIDVALLFWVEVGVFFLVRSLRTGSWPDLLLAGLAQGLAFLCKSYLAFIILGIALAAWLLPICRVARREDCRIGPLRLGALLYVTVLAAAPWLLFCLAYYPEEFLHEDASVWKHLSTNMESWGAPWDRVAFDYLIRMYGAFYTPVLVAGLVFLGKAAARRHAGLWLIFAWGLGVIVPHLLATTKTPSATLLAMPALFLLAGALIAEAAWGERWALVALTGVLALSLLEPAVVRPGHGYPANNSFGAIMRQSLWVVHHVAGASIAAVVFAVVWLLTRGLSAPVWHYARLTVRTTAQVFCLCVLAWFGYKAINDAWRVTSQNVNDAGCVEVGRFARDNLPANAVLLCETRTGWEHLQLMFYADRTCYGLQWRAPDEMARRIQAAGGIPYIVSYRRFPWVPVHVSRNVGPTVYQWRPAE